MNQGFDLLEDVIFDPAETLRERRSIIVLAAWDYLGATPDGIPFRIYTLNPAVVAHLTFSIWSVFRPLHLAVARLAGAHRSFV